MGKSHNSNLRKWFLIIISAIAVVAFSSVFLATRENPNASKGAKSVALKKEMGSVLLTKAKNINPALLKKALKMYRCAQKKE